jgi:hypothetical protein
MIKFTHRSNYIQNYFARYRAWIEFQNLTQTHNPVAVESVPGDDVVNIYEYYKTAEIAADPSPIIGIELKEGLKNYHLMNDSYPKDKHYIIFSGSYPNTGMELKFSHTLICHDAILAYMCDLHLTPKSTYFYTSRTYTFDYPKPMIFVCFNGVDRRHRIEFANYLTELEYSNFIYRLNKQDYGVPADQFDVVDYSKTGSDLAQWFADTAQHTKSPQLHIMGRVPDQMMNLGYFNLVLESDFDFPTLMTSEKVIRPLMLGMPFVLGSTPGHLAYIRSLGFRTYNDIWDESYDLEEDKHKRLRKVFDLCQQLGNHNWEADRAKLAEIGLHNRANFMNLGIHFDREFQEFERIIKDYECRH